VRVIQVMCGTVGTEQQIQSIDLQKPISLRPVPINDARNGFAIEQNISKAEVSMRNASRNSCRFTPRQQGVHSRKEQTSKAKKKLADLIQPLSQPLVPSIFAVRLAGSQ